MCFGAELKAEDINRLKTIEMKALPTSSKISVKDKIEKKCIREITSVKSTTEVMRVMGMVMPMKGYE